MESKIYLSILGNNQGQFQGEGSAPGRSDKWVPLVSIQGAPSSPDLQMRRIPGQRKPPNLRVVKVTGPASLQLFRAADTNEILSSVVIEFVSTHPNGAEFVDHTIRLSNARVAKVERTFPRGPLAHQGTRAHDAFTLAVAEEDTRVGFTYQKIVWEFDPGKIPARDDWYAQ
jgi:type VI secretion system secreted protein Hcp